jgi:Metallo-beta-lactamase superfamily
MSIFIGRTLPAVSQRKFSKMQDATCSATFTQQNSVGLPRQLLICFFAQCKTQRRNKPLRFRRGGMVMLRRAKMAASFVLVAFSLVMVRTPVANAGSKLPDPVNAGVAEKLFRLDCGHSLANDESVWTPGENVGHSIEFSSTCWLIKHGSEWLLWDSGVPESAYNNPQGWSTLPKLIVYHLDKTLTGQLAEIGLKPSDVGRVAISHTHGDHIGNVGLFPNSTILMQRAEYSWINSPNGPNDNVNQLMALARELLGAPKNFSSSMVIAMYTATGASLWYPPQGTPPATNRF